MREWNWPDCGSIKPRELTNHEFTTMLFGSCNEERVDTITFKADDLSVAFKWARVFGEVLPPPDTIKAITFARTDSGWRVAGYECRKPWTRGYPSVIH